jgi:hypothetical protein
MERGNVLAILGRPLTLILLLLGVLAVTVPPLVRLLRPRPVAASLPAGP